MSTVIQQKKKNEINNAAFKAWGETRLMHVSAEDKLADK